MKKNRRIFCVDLLRGLDIFYLLVISSGLLMPGIFKVWPLKSEAALAFWRHSLSAFAAPGHVPSGFGLLDFTQPLFIFVTGVSASLAMRRFVTPQGVDASAFWGRLLRRTLMLWTFGSLIRGVLSFKLFTGSGSSISFCLYSDTLHTIAVAYFAASVALLLRAPLLRLALGLALIGGMAVVLALFGDYTQHGNAARLFEEAVYSRLGGRAKDFCYLLTTFTWAGMGILASLAGDVLKGESSPWMKVRTLSTAGLVSCIIGWTLSIWIPSIRYIYTVSFVFQTMGLSTFLLSGLYMLTDIWNVRRGTGLLVLFGQCSLAAWMAVHFFGGALGSAADRLTVGVSTLLGGDTYKPLVVSVVRVAILIWVVWAWRRLREVRPTH